MSVYELIGCGLRVPFQSLKRQVSRLFRAWSYNTIHATIEGGFTLKRIRDMIKTYSHFRIENKRLKQIFSWAILKDVQK